MAKRKYRRIRSLSQGLVDSVVFKMNNPRTVLCYPAFIMPINRRDELKELVDEPNETLDDEYKSWLDLSGPEGRANLARHIAALANHGGGRIVFGFTDQLAYAGPNTNPTPLLDRDVVAGIVKKYLEPAFHCDVFRVESAAGNEHIIIVVPPHGAVPVCAKADGPMVAGRTLGIIKGTYYIRKPGPESAPISNASEWSPLIRRCLMHDRTAILAAVDASLRGAPAVPTTDDQLRKWHEAAYAMFVTKIDESKSSADLAKRNVQFSYLIERDDGEVIDHNSLCEILMRVNAEVHDLVDTGWSMFYVFSKPELAPAFTTEPAIDRGEEDFLECSLLNDTSVRDFGADSWRMSVDGKATLLREYWEDNADAALTTGLKPGSWFSPNMMARSLAEFVRHARGTAERFKTPTKVVFRCEWRGLRGRQVFDPAVLWRPGQSTSAEARVVSETFPFSALINEWPRVVSRLGGPVARLFGIGHIFTPQWISGQSSTWRR